MESEVGYHGFLCLGDFLVEDKVADAIIDWHFTYGVCWLEDVGMMADAPASESRWARAR